MECLMNMCKILASLLRATQKWNRKNADVVSPWLSAHRALKRYNLCSLLVYTNLHSLFIHSSDHLVKRCIWVIIPFTYQHKLIQAQGCGLKVDSICWWLEAGRMIYLHENSFQISQYLCCHGYRFQDRNAVTVGKATILNLTQTHFMNLEQSAVALEMLLKMCSSSQYDLWSSLTCDERFRYGLVSIISLLSKWVIQKLLKIYQHFKGQLGLGLCVWKYHK